MGTMDFDFIIQPNGNVVTEVVKRTDTICSNIKVVTNAIGPELSDEHLSDDCDRVEEVAVVKNS